MNIIKQILTDIREALVELWSYRYTIVLGIVIGVIISNIIYLYYFY